MEELRRPHANPTPTGQARTHKLNALGIVEVSHREPVLDYRSLFQISFFLTGSRAEAEQLFRLMRFNVFARNYEDHANNFTWLCERGEWRLSSVYGLTYSAGFHRGAMLRLARLTVAGVAVALWRATFSRRDNKGWAVPGLSARGLSLFVDGPRRRAFGATRRHFVQVNLYFFTTMPARVVVLGMAGPHAAPRDVFKLIVGKLHALFFAKTRIS